MLEGTGAQQFRGLVMSEIHRRRPRQYKCEFSFVGNDRRLSQKSGTRRENKKRSWFSRFIPVHMIEDIYGFEFLLVGKNLGQSGNSQIPFRLGFSRHMKTSFRKPGKHQSWKQWCCRLCWKLPDGAQSFFFSVHKFWLNKLMQCFYWSITSKW